jgi:hypothetical protein
LRRLSIDSGTLLLLAVVTTITAILSSGCSDGNTESKQPLETTMGTSSIKTATIRVTGTPGTSFSGSYDSKSAGMRSVEGEVPQDYNVYYNSFPGALDTITATMQKQAEDYSRLTVQIVVDEQVKKEQSTAAVFGVAKVSWSASER